MNIKNIINKYNLHERKQLSAESGQVIADEQVVRFLANDANGSYVAFYHFPKEVAELKVKQEIAFFNEQGRNFEWKTYSTDAPSNLGEVLLENGFAKADEESFMVLDLSEAKEGIASSVNFKEVDDSKGIRDAIDVQEQVWNARLTWQYEYLLALKLASPDKVSIYVVYEGERAVASAWIIFKDNSPFAGIWGGSTVEACCGKGYYTAMLNERIKEAKRRGKEYLVIDASSMSRPIVEKHGFKFVAQTVGYDYQINGF